MECCERNTSFWTRHGSQRRYSNPGKIKPGSKSHLDGGETHKALAEKPLATEGFWEEGESFFFRDLAMGRSPMLMQAALPGLSWAMFKKKKERMNVGEVFTKGL